MDFLELGGQEWRRITCTLESSFGVQQLNHLISQQFPTVNRKVNWVQSQANMVHELVPRAKQQGVLDQLFAAITSDAHHMLSDPWKVRSRHADRLHNLEKLLLHPLDAVQ